MGCADREARPEKQGAFRENAGRGLAVWRAAVGRSHTANPMS